MGIYINPGNSGFAEINDADYIDKTLLIEQVNRTIGTRDKLTCQRLRSFLPGMESRTQFSCLRKDLPCLPWSLNSNGIRVPREQSAS